MVVPLVLKILILIVYSSKKKTLKILFRRILKVWVDMDFSGKL